MKVSASLDYAVRAMVELAAAAPDRPVKGDAIAARQQIAVRFLEQILAELRRAGLVCSSRGTAGGYWLARPASDIRIADVVRAVEGPLADVHGTAPEDLDPPEPAGATRDLWVATRAALRSVLERVTLADLAAGRLPREVRRLLDAPDAWERRETV